MSPSPAPPVLRAVLCSGLALSSLACAGSPPAPRRSLGEALRSYAVAVPDAPALCVLSESRRQGGEKTFHSIVAEGPGLHVRLEIISPMPPDRASLYARTRSAAIRSLYEDPASLYPGESSRQARCPPERKPREVALTVLGTPQSGLLAGAAADRAFGACADGEVKFAGVYLPLHDPETGALLQFSVFAPLRGRLQDAAAPATVFLEGLTRRPREP